MAALCKNIFRSFSQLSIRSLPLTSSKFTASSAAKGSAATHLMLSRHCNTPSVSQTRLMEFFDDENNWSNDEVKVGRAWTLDDLRIKSNSDLHKLWYVLLKERNMLLTMEHACKEEVELFPSPERIDKVNESMTNLELVVRERNRAYHELETGESGERPVKIVNDQIGMPYKYGMSEHLIPKSMNRKWRETHKFGYEGRAVRNFLRRYREKLTKGKKGKIWRDVKRVENILEVFPNADPEAIKKQFPDVDYEKTSLSSKARGNHQLNKN